MKIGRRVVLKGFGTALALPFLESVTPAWAQSAARARRLGLFTIPNGAPWADICPQIKKGSVAPLPDPISPLLQDLNPHRAHLTVLSGMAVPAAYEIPKGLGIPDYHATTATLFNCRPLKVFGERGNYSGNRYSGEESFDHLLARSLAGPHARKFLNLGVASSYGTANSMHVSRSYFMNSSFNEKGRYPARYSDPGQAFRDLFNAGVGTKAEAARLKQQESRRQGILHFVNESVRELNVQLSPSDRAVMDEYLTSIEEKERDLAALSRIQSCSNKDTKGLGASVNASGNYDLWLRNLTDIMFLAFRCDMMPVATLIPDADGYPGRDFKPVLGINAVAHTASHYRNPDENPGDLNTVRANYGRIVRYYVQHFARLVEKMNQTREGEGTMLDNSILVLLPHQGDSHHHYHHWIDVTLAGRGAGTIKPGKCHDFRKAEGAENGAFPPEKWDGRPLADLWLTLMQAMGMSLTRFADSTAPIDLRA